MTNNKQYVTKKAAKVPRDPEYLRKVQRFESHYNILEVCSKRCCKNRCLLNISSMASSIVLDYKESFKFIYQIRKDLIEKCINLKEIDQEIQDTINLQYIISGTQLQYQLHSPNFQDGKEFTLCQYSFSAVMDLNKSKQAKMFKTIKMEFRAFNNSV